MRLSLSPASRRYLDTVRGANRAYDLVRHVRYPEPPPRPEPRPSSSADKETICTPDVL